MINIQDEAMKIHSKFGITEKANYEIQLLAERYAKEYHESELKKLRVGDVVGRSEQFNCGKQRVYGEEQCKKQCNDCINEYGDN